jgi:hypothetical protein
MYSYSVLLLVLLVVDNDVSCRSSVCIVSNYDSCDLDNEVSCTAILDCHEHDTVSSLLSPSSAELNFSTRV